MSSTKQCISCNREMPIASESCVCGRVLSDIKSLGLEGKRYSGYREELYSRLEIRRILKGYDEPKRPKPKLKQKLPDTKQDITCSLHKPQMKRRHKRKSPGLQHKVANTKQRSQLYQVKNNPSPQTKKLIVFTIHEHGNICVACPNCQVGFATGH